MKLENGQFLRITELYAFISKDRDGNEGVMGIAKANGMLIPLIGADIERVESLKPIADEAIKASNGAMSYEIRYFKQH